MKFFGKENCTNSAGRFFLGELLLLIFGEWERAVQLNKWLIATVKTRKTSFFCRKNKGKFSWLIMKRVFFFFYFPTMNTSGTGRVMDLVHSQLIRDKIAF